VGVLAVAELNLFLPDKLLGEALFQIKHGLSGVPVVTLWVVEVNIKDLIVSLQLLVLTPIILQAAQVLVGSLVDSTQHLVSLGAVFVKLETSGVAVVVLTQLGAPDLVAAGMVAHTDVLEVLIVDGALLLLKDTVRRPPEAELYTDGPAYMVVIGVNPCAVREFLTAPVLISGVLLDGAAVEVVPPVLGVGPHVKLGGHGHATTRQYGGQEGEGRQERRHASFENSFRRLCKILVVL